MNSRKTTGKLGEDIATNYLINKSYKIIERNYWQPWGEIDIVAVHRDGTLVFFEVKAIRQSGIKEFGDSGSEIRPEDNLTKAKLRKLQRTCQLYAGSHRELAGERGWRIDLLAIDILNNDLTYKSTSYNIRHYENVC